ncbi:MAG: hypothetical protein H7326_03605, partial [Bdellovibrionaceae bacterium]|nr:hypothetical protein [Pseudobdellovibrionaceae bacterium]
MKYLSVFKEVEVKAVGSFAVDRRGPTQNTDGIKTFLFVLFLLSANAFAVQKIQLEPIAFGNSLQISGSMQLPKGQKLNHMAPSRVGVYEKQNNRWELTEEIDLNNFFALSEMINFQKPIKLNSDKSEIKIEASLYHCFKLGHGICVIDDFEGLVKRSSKKNTSELRLALLGS